MPERLPLENYVLQPAPRDMPMSTALSVRSPLQSISEHERSERGPRKGGTRAGVSLIAWRQISTGSYRSVA